MDIEFFFPVGMALFGIAFIVWIFCKCYFDDREEKAMRTELFRKYGVQTTARVLRCGEHIHTQRTMPYQYELLVAFDYKSPIQGSLCPCLAKVLTNNPNCTNLEHSVSILYIPQYADFVNGFVGSKKLCQQIGIRVYQHSDKLIILNDDISIHTNLSEW